jgi:protein disulfide-isomerase A1
MDATVNSETPSKFDVEGFPTLKFFRNGQASDYGGGRTESEIVNWIRKKSGPAAKTVSTVSEADGFKNSADVTVIGLFSSAESNEAKVRVVAARAPWVVSAARSFMRVALYIFCVLFFLQAFLRSAAGMDDVSFAISTSDEVAVSFGVSAPAIVLTKQFDEGRVDFTGQFETSEINTFVSSNFLPLVVPFNQKVGSLRAWLHVFVNVCVTVLYVWMSL